MKTTSDAVTNPQSVDAEKPVSPCKYRHNWIMASRVLIAGDTVIRCAACGAFPKPKEFEQAKAIVDLKAMLEPGDTVYTKLQSVSRSGMSRVIQLIVMRENEPRWIGYTAALAMGDTYDRKREGIKISGCGMDMGFKLVYDLAYTLFADGYALQQRWL